MFKQLKNRVLVKLKVLLALPQNKKHEMLCLAFPAIKSWGIKGEYFEFGVYQGRAFVEAFRMSRETNLVNMRFYAFDSFEGLPTPSIDEGDNKFKAGQYACSKEDFVEILQREGVDLDHVSCIKGFFSKSLTPELQNKILPRKVAIVWVDCDLYESTVPVLDFILPFLQTGTIICYDDWFSFASHPMKGEIRATREWLERNPQIVLTQYRDFGVSGRSFIVHVADDHT